MSKKTGGILIGIVLFILLGLFAYGMFVPYTSAPIVTPSLAPTQVQIDNFSYEGKEGQNALALLKAKTKVEQNSSGLVTSINGRKADDKKKEFWAFYVNGKFANLGPADYVTKDGDKIEWKIDHF